MTDSTRSSTDPGSQRDAHTATGGDPGEGDGSVVLLHVEPDPRSTELLAAFVKRFADKISVRSVGGMEAALDAIDAADCVVTEQRLPDGSGVELVERIRGREIDVPVVFHSTCRGDETEARAIDAGADAYFSKRSERGQYARVLEGLREVLDDDGRVTSTPTVLQPDATESPVGTSVSEE